MTPDDRRKLDQQLQVQRTLNEQAEEVDRLKAENERLRKALELLESRINYNDVSLVDVANIIRETLR